MTWANGGWPNTRWVRTFDTNENLAIAKLEPNSHFELTDLRALFTVKGTAGGSETLQATITTQLNNLSVAYASSNTVDLSDAINSTHWHGWIGFTFSTPVNMRAGNTYYVTIATANYTRNGTTFYIGSCKDSPETINKLGANESSLSGVSKGAAIELFGYNYEAKYGK